MEQATVARYCGVHILDNPFSIDGAFHYYVPPFMAAAVTPGAFVTVPFGRGNRKQLALVVEAGDDSVLPSDLRPEQVKPVDSVCREKLFLSPRQLELCFHLKKTTLCTLGEAVRAVVPAQALASLTEFYTLAPGDSDKLESRRAALCSVVSIAGFIDVPLVFLSARLWRSIHPSVFASEGGGLTSEMAVTVVACVLCFALVWLALLLLRWGQMRLSARLDAMMFDRMMADNDN